MVIKKTVQLSARGQWRNIVIGKKYYNLRKITTHGRHSVYNPHRQFRCYQYSQLARPCAYPILPHKYPVISCQPTDQAILLRSFHSSTCSSSEERRDETDQASKRPSENFTSMDSLKSGIFWCNKQLSQQWLYLQKETKQVVQTAAWFFVKDVYKRRYNSALAEMELIRQRNEKATTDARQHAIQSFAKDLLDVADVLDKALASVQRNHNAPESAVEEITEESSPRNEKESPRSEEEVSRINDESNKIVDSFTASNDTISQSDNETVEELAVNSIHKAHTNVDNMVYNVDEDSLLHMIGNGKEGTSSSQDLTNLLQGVHMTNEQLQKVFNQHGLVKYNPLGEPFDPNVHEAVFMVPDSGFESGRVAVVQKVGYMLHNRPVRPAIVGVAI